jgi:hypothetical protein
MVEQISRVRPGGCLTTTSATLTLAATTVRPIARTMPGTIPTSAPHCLPQLDFEMSRYACDIINAKRFDIYY